MSLAIFTDSDASNGSWTSGTIILNVTPATSFNVNNMMPGDSGNQTLTVSNTGTGALRYAMTSHGRQHRRQGPPRPAEPHGPGRHLRGARAPRCTPARSTAPRSATPAQGANAGDRNVASGGSDSLCFSWSFPLSSDNSYQNAATTATFTFAAEQTANNP